MCLISFAVVPFDQLVQLSSIRRLFGRPKRPFSHWRQQTTLTPPAHSCTHLQVAGLRQSTWMLPLTGDKAPQGCDCVCKTRHGLACTGLDWTLATTAAAAAASWCTNRHGRRTLRHTRRVCRFWRHSVGVQFDVKKVSPGCRPIPKTVREGSENLCRKCKYNLRMCYQYYISIIPVLYQYNTSIIIYVYVRKTILIQTCKQFEKSTE